MNFLNNSSAKWLLAFTGVFAVLAAFVFWGTWSMDVAPVMPDDPYNFPSVYSDVLRRYVNGFLQKGKMVPTDMLWSGLLISPYFCQELKYVVSVFFAALGLAYYLRGRGLSQVASFGAGLLLAFCGYWFTLFSAGHGCWFIWMTYGVFGFGLADRAVRLNRLRHWLLLGLIVSWAGFNQQDLWLLFTMFTTAYFVWCCVRERKLPWKGALIALATFTLVGLVNFKDTFQNVVKGRVEQMERGENITQKGDAKVSEADKRWEFVTNWSMPLEDTLEFVSPHVHGDTSCPFVLSINAHKGVKPYTGALGRPLNAKQGNYRQHSLYVGWVTVLLALCGIVLSAVKFKQSNNQTIKQFDSDVVFFGVAALVFYSFSLGRYFEPAYRVIFALPAGDLIRCPVKWHHLTELCLCALAGYGIESLRGLRVLRGLRGEMILAALVLIGAANLAFEAKRFCAPVNVGPARRMNATMQMTILPRQQFQNPQVAAMAKAGHIVSIANYMGNPDYFVVGILQTNKKPGWAKPDGLAVGLGVVSLLTALGALGLAFKKDKVLA